MYFFIYIFSKMSSITISLFNDDFLIILRELLAIPNPQITVNSVYIYYIYLPSCNQCQSCMNALLHVKLNVNSIYILK